jgi:hypothetical protein
LTTQATSGGPLGVGVGVNVMDALGEVLPPGVPDPPLLLPLLHAARVAATPSATAACSLNKTEVSLQLDWGTGQILREISRMESGWPVWEGFTR